MNARVYGDEREVVVHSPAVYSSIPEAGSHHHLRLLTFHWAETFLALPSSFDYTILLTAVTLCVMEHQDFLIRPVDLSSLAPPTVSWPHFN